MQLAHQFLLADISNAVPMPAGCQGRTRLVPDVAAPNKSTWSICLCLLPLRRDPGFHAGDARPCPAKAAE
jgi:hypothetical protein